MATNHIRAIEDYFSPGFKTKPAVFIGSQTSEFIRGNAEEQAWEGFYLGAARPADVVVVRDYDPFFLTYWSNLMGEHEILNIIGKDPKEYLSQILLDDEIVLDEIKKRAKNNSRLMVFFPTKLEEELAQKLAMPLHGSHTISSTFGTKSGSRLLAQKAGAMMPEGYICRSLPEALEAIRLLREKFDRVIVKHDNSFSGYFSKLVENTDFFNIKNIFDEVCGGKFIEGKDVVVVEGWLKSKASVCAHIEIIKGEPAIICSSWQQIIDKDGITYMGAGPLHLSDHAFQSLLEQVKRIASALEKEGAEGSFGPDFLITDDSETRSEPDSAVFIEMNARVPYTAVPLEIVKDVRGKIGSGFLAKHIKVPPNTSFSSLQSRLSEKSLLVTEKNPHAVGVVPYNIGLLPYGIFDAVVMADSFEETKQIAEMLDKAV